MAEHHLRLQGIAYVPGVARGVLQRGHGGPGDIALVSEAQAVAAGHAPAALIVIDGAPLSHRMIGLVARAVPTVLVSAAQVAGLRPGHEVLVDGSRGIVTTDLADGAEGLPPPIPEVGRPVQLADGTEVWLMASVRGVHGAAAAVAQGAGSIGLVRSEFLGSDRTAPPDAAYLTATLEALCNAAAPLRVTVRLIDLAADKPPRWLPAADRLLRPLGRQGARLFDLEPVHRVLVAQLQALQALSARHALEVLIPYLGRHEELLHWTGEVRRSLPPGLPLGAMLETPAAVLDLDRWIDDADFFAIGCNDLMQCLFGADRDEPALRDSLDPYAPVLYRLLGQAADAAGEALHRVRLCGVLPRLTGVLPVLVGLGYRRFSIEPAWIPYLARDLRVFHLAAARELAGKVTGCATSRAVRAALGQPETPAG